ncbi:MAG: hypothetical protein JWM19_3750 [Actinomycetia bacterium]|nr:hypothetical protein [Actinomycetes bacterium]
MVYYAVGSGACDSTIYSIPDGGGGTPTPIVSGTPSAISPDGTKLAYAVEPRAAQDCSGWDTSTPRTAFKVDIRTISSGTTVGTSNAQEYIGANVTTVPVTGASPNGQSYLSEDVYLPDGDLYMSQGGARPSEVTSGLAAAAWA